MGPPPRAAHVQLPFSLQLCLMTKYDSLRSGVNSNVSTTRKSSNQLSLELPIGWAKKENILQPFIQKAIESIPHLKDAEILIKYHVNDRYDVQPD